MTDDPTGYALPVGSYEDARAMVGHRTDVRCGHAEVNEAMVRTFCALVRDPNPSCWDRDYASRNTSSADGGPRATTVQEPPFPWPAPHHWRPPAGNRHSFPVQRPHDEAGRLAATPESQRQAPA